MLPRPVKNPNYDAKDLFKKLDSILSKIYTFLVIGWIIEIVGFSAEKINYSGTQFNISNQYAFPGVIYIVCILFYIKLFALMAYTGIIVGFDSRTMTKRAVRIGWLSSVSGKKVSNPIRYRKLHARVLIFIWGLMLFGAALFPALYIGIFKYKDVWKALSGAPIGQ